MEARYTIIATHSLLAALETGDMEVDDFVTRDDVGNTIATNNNQLGIPNNDGYRDILMSILLWHHAKPLFKNT